MRDLGNIEDRVLRELIAAKRPVLIFGSGIKRSGAEHEAQRFAGITGYMVCPTWGAIDLFPGAAAFGTHGNPLANAAVQSADYILCVGSRLDTKATGTPASSFATKAKIAMVDIDPSEMEKMRKVGVPLHRAIRADAKDFLKAILIRTEYYDKFRYEL